MGGGFKIDGESYEWKHYEHMFTTECYDYDGVEWYNRYYCQPWSFNNRYEVTSGNSTNNGLVQYELNLQISMVKQGYIKFKYDAVTRMNELGILNGYFAFYVNGKLIYVDHDAH